MQKTYDLLDVKLVLRNGRIEKKSISLAKSLRKLERWIIPAQEKGIRWQMTRLIRKTRRRLARIRGIND
jgi:hypothetical protein